MFDRSCWIHFYLTSCSNSSWPIFFFSSSIIALATSVDQRLLDECFAVWPRLWTFYVHKIVLEILYNIIIVVCISHDARDSHYLALILQRALLVDQKTELQLEFGQPLLVLTLQLLPGHLVCQHSIIDLFVCVSVSCLSSHLHEVIVGAPEDVHLHLQPVDVLTLDPHVHRANVHLGAGHLRLELFVQHLVWCTVGK